MMTPPNGIDNVWGFLAFIVFAAIVGTPGLLSYRATKKNDKKTDEVVKNTSQMVNSTSQMAKAVTTTEETLTTNNSGSHVKDQLDRMERGITEVLTEQNSIKEEQKDSNRRLDNLEYTVSRLNTESRKRWFK